VHPVTGLYANSSFSSLVLSSAGNWLKWPQTDWTFWDLSEFWFLVKRSSVLVRGGD
jgi:hypothetical protein